MTNYRPVFGVVPHYNNTESLGTLMPQLYDQGYDGLYIIDDCSTGQQREQLTSLASEHQSNGVHFLQNDRNRGAGYTRNRVLATPEIERYGNAILHFVDSDIRFLTQGAAHAGRALMTGNVAMAGGLIQTQTDGQAPRQMAFNFGPRFSNDAFKGSSLQLKADQFARQGKVAASKLMRVTHHNLLQHWPDTTQQPAARETFWCAEANLFVSADALRRAGGFLQMRAHDVQLPALKFAEAGWSCRFDPCVAVSHPAAEATTSASGISQLAAASKILRYVGLRNYFKSEQ